MICDPTNPWKKNSLDTISLKEVLERGHVQAGIHAQPHWKLTRLSPADKRKAVAKVDIEQARITLSRDMRSVERIKNEMSAKESMEYYEALKEGRAGAIIPSELRLAID